jgi:hypothetical protein
MGAAACVIAPSVKYRQRILLLSARFKRKFNYIFISDERKKTRLDTP